MDPVELMERIANTSVPVLLLAVTIAVFIDSLALIGVLLPGDLLLLVPSAAVGPDGAWVIVVGSLLGTVLGYAVSYSLGQWSGPVVRRSWVGRRIGTRRWEQAEQLLRGPGARALLTMQFLPVLNCLVPLLAGTLQVPRWRFVRLTAAGSVLWSGTYAVVGSAAGHTGDAVADYGGQLVALVIVAVPAGLFSAVILTRATHRMAGRDQVQYPSRLDGDSCDMADSTSC
ncbi:MAG: DedA family protein [Pseudonocardiaceae bacterium]